MPAQENKGPLLNGSDEWQRTETDSVEHAPASIAPSQDCEMSSVS
eukprot:COSAG03_NODE_16473_length_400_cov_128.956811_1_plen_44_part_01